MSHTLRFTERRSNSRSVVVAMLDAARILLAIIFGVATILLFTSCAPSIKVDTDFSPTAQFGNYRYYAFVDVPPRAAQFNALDPLLTERTRAAIDSNLSRKQMRRVDNIDQANILIFTWAATKENISIDDLGYQYPGIGYGPTSVIVDTYTSGTLVIDMVDPATRNLVWRSIATGAVSDRKQAQAAIPEAVGKMLKKYPPANAPTNAPSTQGTTPSQ